MATSTFHLYMYFTCLAIGMQNIFQLADVDHDSIAAGNDNDDVWSVGFRMEAIYNQGNTSRQALSEIFVSNFASINSKFKVKVVGLPWPEYLNALRDSELPFYVSGWIEDYHDPHSWYAPYLTGA